jgi:hypothetical protein
MKKILSLLITCVCIQVYAQPNVIYQVSEWNSKTVRSTVPGEFTYTNDELVITYNFWSGSKEITFSIFNKTDKAISIDWSRCHFIIWNYSNDFSKTTESTFTTSTLSRTTASRPGMTQAQATVVKSPRSSHIPPNSMISESFTINNSLYFDCNNYFKKLKKDETVKYDFTEGNSPYKLRNYLTYSSDADGKEKTLDNDFYITQVLNMNSETFHGAQVKSESCDAFGKKTVQKVYSYPYRKSNRQYQTIMVQGSCCGM